MSLNISEHLHEVFPSKLGKNISKTIAHRTNFSLTTLHSGREIRGFPSTSCVFVRRRSSGCKMVYKKLSTLRLLESLLMLTCRRRNPFCCVDRILLFTGFEMFGFHHFLSPKFSTTKSILGKQIGILLVLVILRFITAKEMQQRKQIVKRVTDWRSCQAPTVKENVNITRISNLRELLPICCIESASCLRGERVGVLDHVRFIEDDAIPTTSFSFLSGALVLF